MNLSLNKQQTQLINLVRQLARDEIRPYAQNHDFTRNEGFDWYLIRQLGKQILEVTRTAADILAARAFEKGSYIGQLLRDALALSIIEGTNNITRNIISPLLL